MGFNAEQIIQPSDFHSVVMVVSFKNLVSGLHVPEEQISLDETGEKVLVFGLPASSCNVDHNVMFEVHRVDGKKNGPQGGAAVFKATGKVIGIEKTSEDRMRVAVNLIQYDEASLKAFLGVFADRQDEINNFLKMVKG